MSGFMSDLRLALRRLASAPGFTFASVAMLALGIGFSVAMVATVDGVLLRGLPLHDPDRIVVVRAANPTQDVDNAQFTTREAELLAGGTPGFDALGYYWWSGVTLFDGERAREITTHVVGAGYFEALGIAPVLGRVLNADDVREDRGVAVLSHAEWQRAFGGSADVIGKRLELVDEDPLEIVGVLPPSAELVAGDTGVWRPLAAKYLPQDGLQRERRRTLLMVGRLAAGTTTAQADAALQQRFEALAAERGETDTGWRATTRPLIDVLVGDARTALWGAFALAVLVLLVAAANVAILLDARQLARRREQAVLQAIGASRGRLRRELALELGLLATAAVVAGSGVAAATIALLREFARDSVPRVDGIVLDARVLAVAAVFGLAVPCLAALAGALRVHGSPAEAMRAGGKGLVGQAGQRRALPALAMALSTLSLVAALALAGGLWRLQAVEPGYATANVHAMQFFRGGREAFVPFTEQLAERLGALPGVRGVAVTSAAPLSGIGSASVDLRTPDQGAEAGVQSVLRRVSADYLGVLGMPLVGGRGFEATDRRGAEAVAILNRTAARRVFGDVDPLGRTLSVPIGRERVDVRVVGLVDDIRNDGLRMPAAPEVLVPFAQFPINAMTFLVRGDRPLPGIDAQMAAALAAIDPRQAVTRHYALAGDIAEQLRPARFFARTVGAFAGAALLLAVLGVYAVASLQQQRRISEFGLRLAVGARPVQLASRVLRDSVATSATGVFAGLVAVAIVLRVIDLRELGVDGWPLGALAAGVAAMAAAALLAAALPAWRASRVAPMVALRDE